MTCGTIDAAMRPRGLLSGHTTLETATWHQGRQTYTYVCSARPAQHNGQQTINTPCQHGRAHKPQLANGELDGL